MRVLSMIYFYGFIAAALVENFRYLRDEGFWAWLLWGEVISLFKAAIWPWTLFTSLTG